MLCHRPQAEAVREVLAFTHGLEEFGDVHRTETLGKQSIDDLQLGQVVLVIDSRATDSTWRFEQSPFPVGANVARTHTRNLRQVLDPIFSHGAYPTSERSGA